MRSKAQQIVEASREEALLAVDLYNQPKRPRRLEAYFVHMHIAWLYLLHARFVRDSVDFRYRLPNGRFDKIDGEPKTWGLGHCVSERWGANDPIRKNLELTIALRNKIEHRFEDATVAATSGYAHALLVNYEEELTATFGPQQSLADQLRFPVFIGTFTGAAVGQLQDMQKRLPARTRNFLAKFVSDVGSVVADDSRFEFRINLVQKLGSKTDSESSMTFVRDDELTPSQRKAFEQMGKKGTVVIREQKRPVASLGLMKPLAASVAIEGRIPFRFRASAEFPAAWKKLECRPPSKDPNPERTIEKYCIWDELNDNYGYTPAFVEKVIRETKTEESFRTFIGRKPTKKPTSSASGVT